jgi:hypothetical protein
LFFFFVGKKMSSEIKDEYKSKIGSKTIELYLEKFKTKSGPRYYKTTLQSIRENLEKELGVVVEEEPLFNIIENFDEKWFREISQANSHLPSDSPSIMETTTRPRTSLGDNMLYNRKNGGNSMGSTYAIHISDKNNNSGIFEDQRDPFEETQTKEESPLEKENNNAKYMQKQRASFLNTPVVSKENLEFISTLSTSNADEDVIFSIYLRSLNNKMIKMSGKYNPNKEFVFTTPKITTIQKFKEKFISRVTEGGKNGIRIRTMSVNEMEEDEGEPLKISIYSFYVNWK